MVRIGVTGHRTFEDEVGATAAIDDVLDRLAAEADGVVELVSSLAEGADRIVASRAMARLGARLDVILPLEPTDYSTDFGAPESRAAFDALVQQATTVTVVAPQPTRRHAYEAAGLAMVDASDVVVAVWDGEPARGRGGVAEIVRYALDHDVPVEVVLVRRGGEA